MRYNVLYVEDMSKDLFLDNAYEKKIDIVILKYYDDLISELSKKDHPWDAVILDAFGKCNEDDPKLGFSGLAKATKFLDSLKGDKSLPYFIYTGEDEKFGGEFNDFSDTYEDYYEKGTEDEKLINDIKDVIEDQPNAIIRQRYPKVFKLFKEGFINNDEYEKNLIEILKSIDGDLEIDDELYFNQLRQMLEVAMRRANEVGILHNKCITVKNEVILKLSSIFLSGGKVSKLNIKCSRVHFPKIISDHVFDILDITNIGSHADKEGKEQSEANLKEYRKMLNTPYLLYSLTFKLMDVLLWFSEYIKENNNIELNKALWIDLDPVEKPNAIIKDEVRGTVLNIHEKGFSFLQPLGSTNSDENLFIPPNVVSDSNLQEGIEVEGEVGDGKQGPEIKSVKILRKG